MVEEDPWPVFERRTPEERAKQRLMVAQRIWREGRYRRRRFLADIQGVREQDRCPCFGSVRPPRVSNVRRRNVRYAKSAADQFP